MQLSDKIFFSSSIEDKRQKKIIKKLNKKKIVKGLYYLLQVEESKNLIEIVGCNEMKRCINRGKIFIIIGIADSNNDAKELTRDIVETVYRETNEINIDYYFGYR